MKLKKSLIALLCVGALGTTAQTVFAEVNPNERAAVTYSFSFVNSERTTPVKKQSQSTYGNVRLDEVNANGKVTMRVNNSSGKALSNSTATMTKGKKYAMTYIGDYGSGYWGHSVHGFLQTSGSSGSTVSGRVFWSPDSW